MATTKANAAAAAAAATTVTNAQVKVTKTEVTANEELGTEAKTIYYLILITDKGKKVINVGKGTHDSVKELL